MAQVFVPAPSTLQTNVPGVIAPAAGALGRLSPEAHRSGMSAAATTLTAALVAAAVPVVGSVQRRRRENRSRMPRNFNPSAGDVSAEDVKNANLFSVIENTKDYKEQDRKFRRPVFGYADWVTHRSADRFVKNLSTVFVSRIARAIWLEVLAPTMVAFFVLFYYDYDWSGLWESLKLAPTAIEALKGVPAFTTTNLPFTACSPCLSLLLVFKTNAAYGRWWEARKVWGAVVNKTRDLVRQAIARIDPKYEHVKAEITRLTASFPYILTFHTGEQTDADVAWLKAKLEELLTEKEASYIMSAVHKPMTLCGMLSEALEKANLDLFDKMKMDGVISDFADYYGMCERIFKTPIPLSYTRLTARFLSVWMLCLPFALYTAVTPHYLIIPITFFLSSFVFGIEELGMQIEEPFSVLPQEKISNGIEASIMEAFKLNSTAGLKAMPPDTAIEEIQQVAQVVAAPPAVAAAPAISAPVAAVAPPQADIEQDMEEDDEDPKKKKCTIM